MQNKSKTVVLFDTTCRDGNQDPTVHLSAEEKRLVASWLDYMGVGYIELGWPGANPTDDELFENLPILQQAKMAAFGMTHKKGLSPETDNGFRRVAESPAAVICLFGKTWDKHVLTALHATPEENLDMIRNSVSWVKKQGKEMVFDAEHFFDGFKNNKAYALECLRSALEGGADWLVLCDTNGGSTPDEISEIVRETVREFPNARFGIHCHNDCEMAVANSFAAVKAGCSMVQGTINGIGERCGNANLTTLMGLLGKLGYDTGISPERLKELRDLSREMDALLGRKPNKSSAFVGDSAFAHKGGVHASAVKKDPALYEHTNPEFTGNRRSFPVSDQSGASNILMLLKSMGIEADGKNPQVKALVDSVKRRKQRGYTYREAEASLCVLALKKTGMMRDFFKVADFRITDEGKINGHEFVETSPSATVTIQFDGETVTKTASGQGPVHAFDKALRKALRHRFPVMNDVELDDFKVKILNPDKATGATTHVLVSMKNGKTGDRWTTVGVSQDIIVASLEALIDGYNYVLNIDRAPEPETTGFFRKTRLEMKARLAGRHHYRDPA